MLNNPLNVFSSIQNAYFSEKFEFMKKTLFFLLFSILFITGCDEKTAFTLKGQLNNLSSDTLLVYYQVPDYYIDTILCEKGKFEYTFIPDTFTVFSLILDTNESIPVYAEKGETVEIKGTINNYTINGKGENKLMNDITLLLRNTPKSNLYQTIDSLINTNNTSFTNLFLFEKYYANNDSFNIVHLKNLVERQSGIIKDTPYIMEFLSKINESLEKGRNSNIHMLNGVDRHGKSVQWNTIRNNYILIDFWASWHPESVAAQDSLANVLKALKKEKFRIVSLSLDLDKEAWLKASNRDTTQWSQICDFTGWNNQIVKNQNIQTLPANILLDKNRRIIARNIRGNELINKVKEQIKKDKEREIERNKRKQRRK